jgi:hypothetical protein
MGPAKIRRKYSGRILDVLRAMEKELTAAGYTVGAPYYQGDEDDEWWMTACPHSLKQRAEEDHPTDGDVDIRFTILRSETTDGEPGGVTFSVNITGSGGQIIGGMTPGNYSPDLWVPRKDHDAIEARFRLFEAADHPYEVVELVNRFTKRKQKEVHG